MCSTRPTETHDISYKYGVPTGPHTSPANFADTKSERREKHEVLDFSAGKDVGLGLFGSQSSSVLGIGVRFAQFDPSAQFDIRARPDFAAELLSIPILPCHDHRFALPQLPCNGQGPRSFRGMGPSLSWTGSRRLPAMRRMERSRSIGESMPACSSGRQKARVQHQESAQYREPLDRFLGHQTYTTIYQHSPTGHETSRSVTVPNVGGSIGLSWRLQDFELNLGYRYDVFFRRWTPASMRRRNPTSPSTAPMPASP